MKRYTENLDAYNLYLQGRYFWHKWEPGATWKALDYFQQAIAKDPNYAPAYAGVAYSYQRLLSPMGSGGVAIPQGIDKMRAAAERALAIDPLLPEAYGVLGIYNEWHNDLISAEKNFQKALEIDPQNVLVSRWHGVVLSTAGRLEEAAREVRRSLQIDPLSADGHAILAGVLFDAGRNDEGIAACQKALELDPNFHRARWQLGRIYVHKGMYREGIENLLTSEKAGGREDSSPWLGYAYGVAGRKLEATRILGRRLQEDPRRPTAIAMIYTGLGDKDRAIEWLAKSPHFGNSTPEWSSLHGDARFEALARKERKQ
jgi:tetratricopeptide (TPR) repeat protein